MAQITFCPNKSVWNYSFKYIPVNPNFEVYANEKITYEKDSTIGSDNIKILKHNFYYNTCYSGMSVGNNRTFIKQNGDTVFFQNTKTSNSWQILYNFAAGVGNGWQTVLLSANNNTMAVNFQVDSISWVTHNGFTLKRLHCQGQSITERFGSSAFLFPFQSQAITCDGYWFWNSLCYSDSVFGEHKFTEKSCNFSGIINTTNLSDFNLNSQIQCISNPTEGKVRFIFATDYVFPAILILKDISGQEAFRAYLYGREDELNIKHLSTGLYFGDLLSEKQIDQFKIVKL